MTVEPGNRAFPPVPPPSSPFFPGLREHCLSLLDAWVDYPWGDIVFKVGDKMFAATGSRDGVGLGVTVKATIEDQQALVQLPGVTMAPYIGRHGWVTVSISDEPALAFGLDLVSVSYDLVAHPAKKARARSKS